MDPIVVAIVSGVVAQIVVAAVWIIGVRTAASLVPRTDGDSLRLERPIVPGAGDACRRCGNPYPPGSKAVFCRRCGQLLKGGTARSGARRRH
jgi:hypothetical protein